VSDLELAVGFLPVLVIPLLTFAGFFLNEESTPDYFIWFPYIRLILNSPSIPLFTNLFLFSQLLSLLVRGIDRERI